MSRRRVRALATLILGASGCTSPAREERPAQTRILPNLEAPTSGSSGAPPSGVVLDLTHNLVWFVDQGGRVSDVPQQEQEIERLIPANVTTRGSLEERYRDLTPAERQRRMQEVTRVLRCEYENLCLSIVQRLRGAPGDPRGFPEAVQVKREGDLLPFTLPPEPATASP